MWLQTCSPLEPGFSPSTVSETSCMTAVDVLGCWGSVLIGVGGRYGADRGFTVGRSTSAMGLRAAQALSTAADAKDESKPVWREIWRGWWATLRVKWVQRERRALCNSCVCVCVWVCHMGLRDTFSKHIKLKHSSVSILPAICVNACRKCKASVLTSDRKMHVVQCQISVSTIQKYENKLNYGFLDKNILYKIFESNSKHVQVLRIVIFVFMLEMSALTAAWAVPDSMLFVNLRQYDCVISLLYNNKHWITYILDTKVPVILSIFSPPLKTVLNITDTDSWTSEFFSESYRNIITCLFPEWISIFLTKMQRQIREVQELLNCIITLDEGMDLTFKYIFDRKLHSSLILKVHDSYINWHGCIVQ